MNILRDEDETVEHNIAKCKATLSTKLQTTETVCVCDEQGISEEIKRAVCVVRMNVNREWYQTLQDLCAW
jgi:hypothetical protein